MPNASCVLTEPTTSNSSEGRHQIKKEHGPHTEKRDGNGSVVVSEEYLSRIVHLLEKSNDVKQQQIQAYEKSARDQIEANDRRSKEQIEATDRQSKGNKDLLFTCPNIDRSATVYYFSFNIKYEKYEETVG